MDCLLRSEFRRRHGGGLFSMPQTQGDHVGMYAHIQYHLYTDLALVAHFALDHMLGS